MKNSSISKARFLLLLLLGTCPFVSFAAEVSQLYGSKEDVSRQLHADFPLGMKREEVIRLLEQKYFIAKKNINISHVDAVPLRAVVNGKQIEIVSWASAILCEYRSVRFFFFKTTVAATFNFDGLNTLNSLTVVIARGPEL
jgi:hypothetical protein